MLGNGKEPVILGDQCGLVATENWPHRGYTVRKPCCRQHSGEEGDELVEEAINQRMQVLQWAFGVSLRILQGTS